MGRSHKRRGKNDVCNDRWRSKSQGAREKSKVRVNKAGKSACFIYGKEGHWKRECPNRGQRQPGDSSANVASEPRQPMVLRASIHSKANERVMDFGCTFHIAPNKDLLFDVKEIEGRRVHMANNTHCEVKGIGKIKITNPDGSVVILTDVRYMPEMTRNLISYGMLERSGYNYKEEDYTVTFYKDGRKVISGKYDDGLYYL